MDRVMLQFQLIFVFMVFGIIGISILYLSQFSHLTSQGVILEELEYKRNKLMMENEGWRLRITQLSSLDVVTERDIVKSMPNVSEYRYID